MAPPMPMVSFGRPQKLPLIDRPPEALRSTSVKDRISFWPSFQLSAREQADVFHDLLFGVDVESVFQVLPGAG